MFSSSILVASVSRKLARRRAQQKRQNLKCRHFTRNPTEYLYLHRERKIDDSSCLRQPATSCVRSGLRCAPRHRSHSDWTPVRLPYVLSPPALLRGLQQYIRPSATRGSSYIAVCASRWGASCTCMYSFPDPMGWMHCDDG